MWGGDLAFHPITGKYPHLKEEDDLPISWVCERKEGLIEIIYVKKCSVWHTIAVIVRIVLFLW